MPFYICPALRIAANKENCKIVYYHISTDFYPSMDIPENAYILYPDYFGVCSHIVEELSLKYKNLIVDNAHSFFSKPKGIASFASLRKFFPTLRDGSFLYKTSGFEIEEFSQDDFSYIPKYLSYEEFSKNENRLNSQDIKYISQSTLQAYSLIDLEEEKIKRRELFNYFNDYFNGDYKLKSEQVPMAYPYLAKNSNDAQKIASELQQKNINVYRYWNNLPESYSERKLYENLLVICLNVDEFISGGFRSE